MPVVPVDLTKTGGKIPRPGGDVPPLVKPVPTPEARPPEAKPAADKAAEAKQPEGPVVCPHCRLDPAADPAKTTPEDETAFVRAVWRGESFRKAVSLYGGAVGVVLRTLDAEEEDAIRYRLEVRAAGGEFPASYHGEMSRYEAAVSLHLGLTVEELRVGEKVYRYTPGPDCDPEAAHKALRAAAKTEPVYRAVREAYLRFAVTAAALQTRAADPSFPSATAAGG